MRKVVKIYLFSIRNDYNNYNHVKFKYYHE